MAVTHGVVANDVAIVKCANLQVTISVYGILSFSCSGRQLIGSSPGMESTGQLLRKWEGWGYGREIKCKLMLGSVLKKENSIPMILKRICLRLACV